jgi:NADH dehydrogenase
MIGAMRTPAQQLVTVFGGSGFLGRFVVRALARRGYRVRIATRRPDLAFHLQTFGVVGQIQPVQANLRFPNSVAAAVHRADHVVNLVGVLQESGRQTFGALQAEGPRIIAEAAHRDARMVHVSAIGADALSPSHYARSKAEGEQNLLGVRPDAVVVRPSVLFGPGDSFFTRFAGLARALPVLPLAGAETRFQPVYAGDVAEAIAKAIDGEVAGGRIYELGGPRILTLCDLVRYVMEVTERRRPILPLPWGVARMQGALVGGLDRLLLGLMPRDFVITRDQVRLLEQDNVVSDEAILEGRSFAGLGITPSAFEAIVPSYLLRFRKTGQFDLQRNAAPAAPSVPDLLAPRSGGPDSDFHPESAPGAATARKAAPRA